MTPNELVHRLLSQAFAAIHEAGQKAGNRRLSVIADLFQATPLRLAGVAQGEATYDDALAWLREQAQRKGLSAWLEGVIEQLSRWSDASSVDSRALLYRLLYIALIDVRAEAYDTGNEEAWRVAHLFHNIPVRLAEVARGEGSYDDLLARLGEDAQRLGCAAWLEQISREATQPSPAASQA